MTAAAVVGLLVLGLLLMALEVLVIPGFGVAGGLGLVAMLVGVGAAWSELGPWWGTAAAVEAVMVTAALLYWGPRSKLGRRLVLEGADRTKSAPSRAELLGRRGRATTVLRPSGAARIGGPEGGTDMDVDVTTDGEHIDAGTEVEVVAVDGLRVVVAPISPDGPRGEAAAADKVIGGA